MISLAVYYVFVWFSRKLYLAGNTAGFIISVLNAYYWNNKYVFRKSQTGNLKPLVKTYLSYGSTFIVGTALLYVVVHCFGVSELIAPIINLAVTIPINFMLNKYWAFK